MNIGIIFAFIVSILFAVALTGYLFLTIAKRYFDNQQKMQMLQMKIDEHRETVKVITPIRLQAYERMSLFLERISPESLILRCYQPGMDLKLLQSVLTKSIRDEWEHNLSQQVYLSSEAWKRIRSAKEEMIGLVNSSAISLPQETDPAKLAGSIFATVATSQNPAMPALEFLKAEMQEL